MKDQIFGGSKKPSRNVKEDKDLDKEDTSVDGSVRTM